MENTMHFHVNQDIEDDTLSFTDLPLHQHTESNTYVSHHQHHTNQDLFEFSSQNHQYLSPDNIIFCGKIILPNKTQQPVKIPPNHSSAVKPSSRPATAKVLMSNSISGNSRKHKLLIGLLPAKIPSKMELSDIKKRQSRRAPTSMFPAMAADETPKAGQFCKSELLRRRRLPKASFGCFPRARPCIEY